MGRIRKCGRLVENGTIVRPLNSEEIKRIKPLLPKGFRLRYEGERYLEGDLAHIDYFFTNDTDEYDGFIWVGIGCNTGNIQAGHIDDNGYWWDSPLEEVISCLIGELAINAPLRDNPIGDMEEDDEDI